jgi:hypothetical protein
MVFQDMSVSDRSTNMMPLVWAAWLYLRPHTVGAGRHENGKRAKFSMCSANELGSRRLTSHLNQPEHQRIAGFLWICSFVVLECLVIENLNAEEESL